MTNEEFAACTARQVADFADVDLYGVRAEGERRQIAAEKALTKAQRAIEKARREMQEANMIAEAFHAEQAREWAAERRAA